MKPKCKYVKDLEGRQSVAGRINDGMKLIDVPALRGDITYDQAINAWMTMLSDIEQGHFGESVEKTARQRIVFWTQMRDIGRESKVAVLATWLESLNPLLLVTFLKAFWSTDTQSTKGYAASIDLQWLENPGGRIVAAKFIFDTLSATQAQGRSGRG